MIKSIEIQTFDFDCDGMVDYVAIHVTTGLMPPQRIKQYLERLRNEMKICSVLDEKEIPFDIIGVPESKINTSANSVNSSEPKQELSLKVSHGHDTSKVSSGHDTINTNDWLSEEQRDMIDGILKGVEDTKSFDNAMKVVGD